MIPRAIGEGHEADLTLRFSVAFKVSLKKLNHSSKLEHHRSKGVLLEQGF